MKKKGMAIFLLCFVAIGLLIGCGRKEQTEEASLYDIRNYELSGHLVDAAEDMSTVPKETEMESQIQSEAETTTEPITTKKDDSLSLKSLKVNKVSLAVNIDEQEYTVENNVTEVSVTAETKDVMASVISGLGKHSLSVGTNRIEIVVRGSDDSRKSYIINIIRKEKETKAATPSPASPPVNNNYGGGYNYNYNYNYNYSAPAEPTVPPNDGVQIIG